MRKYGGNIYNVILIVLSIGSLALGVNNYVHERKFLSVAELDTGTITDYELYVRKDGLSEYCPRIEFTSKAGEPVAVRGSICPNEPDQSMIGRTVQVYYDPQHPEDYEEKSAFTGYDGLILGVVVAVFFNLLWVVPLMIGVVGRAINKNKPTGRLTPLMLEDAKKYQANQRKAEARRRNEEK